MSNDLFTGAGTQVESAPTTTGGWVGRSRPAGTHHERSRSRQHATPDHPDPSLRPFADADESCRIGRSVRVMLARHLEPGALTDGVALVFAAKVRDELAGGAGFEAVPGAPRVSASRFDHLLREVLDELRAADPDATFADVEVPELVAHQVLRDLGPFSLLLTAEQPGGPTVVRGLFVGAAGDGADARSRVLGDPDLASRLWGPMRSAPGAGSLAAVVAAAVEVFGGGPGRAVHLAGAARAEQVVDLRDTSDPHARRSRRRD
jgi:hypothetical protein